MTVRRLVLDVLKPHEPNVVEYAKTTDEIDGVEGVNISLVEIDEEVQNVKITVEGSGISFQTVKEEIEDLGGSIHSVDEIAYGERLIEKVHTQQD